MFMTVLGFVLGLLTQFTYFGILCRHKTAHDITPGNMRRRISYAYYPWVSMKLTRVCFRFSRVTTLELQDGDDDLAFASVFNSEQIRKVMKELVDTHQYASRGMMVIEITEYRTNGDVYRLRLLRAMHCDFLNIG